MNDPSDDRGYSPTAGEAWEIALLQEIARRYSAGDIDAVKAALDMADAVAHRSSDPYYVAVALLTGAQFRREGGRSAPDSDSALAAAEAAVESLDEQQRESLRPLLLNEQAIRAKHAGRLEQAEALLTEAAELARDAGQLRTYLAGLGDVQLEAGRFDEAERNLERALFLAIKYGGPQDEAEVLVLLGILLERKGDHHGAAQRLSWAGELAESAGALKIAHDARSNMLAFGLISDAESGGDAGVDALLRELDWYDAAGFGGDHSILLGQVAIARARRGRPLEARRLLRASHARNIAAGHTVAAVYDLLNLAAIEHRLRDYEASLRAALDAVRGVEGAQLTDLFWHAHHAVARAQLGRMTFGDAEAIVMLLRRTHHAYELAMSAVDPLRAGVDRPERRELLVADTESLFDEALTFYATVLDQVPGSGARNHAYAACAQSKSRTLLDLLGAERMARAVRDHPLGTRRTALSDELNRLPDDADQVTELLTELRDVRAQIARDAPAIAVTAVAELDEIRVRLPDDTALIEYFVAEQGQVLSVFVITHAGIVRWDRHDLADIDLGQLVARFRAEIGVPPQPIDRATRHIGPARAPNTLSGTASPAGERLHNLLIGDLPAAFGPQVHRLVLVPHRDLHLVPFAALHRTTPAGREWLVDRFDLVVLPSASLLPLCRDMSRSAFRPGSAVVLGNPTGDLPGTAIEATNVARLLGAQPYLGNEATRAALLHPAVPGAITHVASHGVFDRRDPLLSGVKMADARVTVDEFAELENAPALLVLNACVTGLALRRPGDELIGLARAAATAGTPSTVCTLWNVDDDVAAYFAKAFYEALLDGAQLDSAVRRAQRQLRDHKRAEPWYWAAFVLIGDWRGLTA